MLSVVPHKRLSVRFFRGQMGDEGHFGIGMVLEDGIHHRLGVCRSLKSEPHLRTNVVMRICVMEGSCFFDPVVLNSR